MKKRNAFILLVVVVVIIPMIMLTSCTKKAATTPPAATPPQSAETFRIGVALPLTGSTAEEGTRIDKGARLAVKDINAAGGINGQKIELVEMDDRSDPKEAANIANLFVADKSIMACLADDNSSCSLAGAPIYNANHLVHIATVSSSPKISDAGPYTFRLGNSDVYTASFIVQIILDAGYKKIAILYENDDFGIGGFNVAKDALAKVGITPLVEEAYLLGETKDFSTVITKMRNAGCESVLMLSDETELPAFATQCVQQDWKPFICSNGTFNSKVIELGGKNVEGIAGHSLFDPNHLSDKLTAFFKEYSVEYGGTMSADINSPVGYDAVYMIADAMKDGAKTRDDIQKYLATLKNFDGVCGILSFDENGDVKIPLYRIVIKDGKFVPYTGK